MAGEARANAPRTERVLPGVWRLRLPLPWPGVPHVNAWAIAGEDGIVLVDTGTGGRGRLRALDLALAQAGSGSRTAAPGLHPLALRPLRPGRADHQGGRLRALDAPGLGPRAAAGRRPGGGAGAANRGRSAERGAGGGARELPRGARASTTETGVEELREPDRELVAGVEVETDLGAWQVHHTPGHAPSHVVLHQPERRLMITGDHLLGRNVLFFDYGHTADPVGEFLASLDLVEPLPVDLCLPGHGRTFRDPEAKIAEARRSVAANLDRVRDALREGGELTAFDVVTTIAGGGAAEPPDRRLDGCRSSSPTSTIWRSWARSSRSPAANRNAGSSVLDSPITGATRRSRRCARRCWSARASRRRTASGRSVFSARSGRRCARRCWPTNPACASPTSCSPACRSATTSAPSNEPRRRRHPGRRRGPHHPDRSARGRRRDRRGEGGDPAAAGRSRQRGRATRRRWLRAGPGPAAARCPAPRSTPSLPAFQPHGGDRPARGGDRLSAAAVGYQLLKRPATSTTRGVELQTEKPPPPPKAAKTVNWPMFGLDPARTRYLPVHGVKPPFHKVWRYTNRPLLEFPPIYVGGRLYAVNNSGLAYSLDAHNGKELWKRRVGELNASSPAYSKHRLYIVNLEPGHIVKSTPGPARRSGNGPLPGRAESSPVVIGRTVYFGCEDGKLYAISTIRGTCAGRPTGRPDQGGTGLLWRPPLRRRLRRLHERGRCQDRRAGLAERLAGPRLRRLRPVLLDPGGRLRAGLLRQQRRPCLLLRHQRRHPRLELLDRRLRLLGPAVANTTHSPPTVFIGSFDGNVYALDAKDGSVRWSRRSAAR